MVGADTGAGVPGIGGAERDRIPRSLYKLGCEGIVSKRLGSAYRSGRSPHWVKVKNPKAPAVTREGPKRDWGR
jgi:hypothetical protein